MYTHEKIVELNRFCSIGDVGRVNKGTNNEPSFLNEKWSLEKICRLAVNADRVTVKRRWMNKAESDSVLISDGNSLPHSRESIVDNDMINIVVQIFEVEIKTNEYLSLSSSFDSSRCFFFVQN